MHSGIIRELLCACDNRKCRVPSPIRSFHRPKHENAVFIHGAAILLQIRPVGDCVGHQNDVKGRLPRCLIDEKKVTDESSFGSEIELENWDNEGGVVAPYLNRLVSNLTAHMQKWRLLEVCCQADVDGLVTEEMFVDYYLEFRW